LRKQVGCDDCATRSFCIVGRMGPELRQVLEPQIRRRAFQRGEVFCTEGDLSTSIHIVKLGTVFGYRRGLDGRDRPIGIASRGAAFGLFGVLEQPNLSSATASSAGRLCEIPVHFLRELARLNPALSGLVAASAAQSCARIAAWSEGMRMRGVVNQLAYALLLMADSQGQNVLELPAHVAMADLLGTTRETVARALGTLESEGAVERQERKQCVVHPQKLLARLQVDAAEPAAG